MLGTTENECQAGLGVSFEPGRFQIEQSRPSVAVTKIYYYNEDFSARVGNSPRGQIFTDGKCTEIIRYSTDNIPGFSMWYNYDCATKTFKSSPLNLDACKAITMTADFEPSVGALWDDGIGYKIAEKVVCNVYPVVAMGLMCPSLTNELPDVGKKDHYIASIAQTTTTTTTKECHSLSTEHDQGDSGIACLCASTHICAGSDTKCFQSDGTSLAGWWLEDDCSTCICETPTTTTTTLSSSYDFDTVGLPNGGPKTATLRTIKVAAQSQKPPLPDSVIAFIVITSLLGTAGLLLVASTYFNWTSWNPWNSSAENDPPTYFYDD